MVKNAVFSQRGKISSSSLDKVTLVSQKKRYGSEIFREWPQIINVKSQKISSPYCKPFLKYSQMFIGLDSTVHSQAFPPPSHPGSGSLAHLSFAHLSYLLIHIKTEIKLKWLVLKWWPVTHVTSCKSFLSVTAVLVND